MPKAIEIRGDNGLVQIDVLDYERPKSVEGSDRIGFAASAK